MSQWCGQARTNYVLVEDEEGFRNLASKWGLDVIKPCLGDSLLGLAPGVGSDDGSWPSWGAYQKESEDEEDPVFSFESFMAFVKEGEVLVCIEAGSDGLRYLTGYATALVRRGDEVKVVNLSLNEIYNRAAETFGVPLNTISAAEF